MRDSQAPDTEMAGVLFGTVAKGLVHVEAVTRISLPSPSGGEPINERLGKALDEATGRLQLPLAPESLELVGWWCVRAVNAIHQLGNELGFHNQRFRRSTDVLAVFSVQQARIVSARLFAKSCNLPLSIEHHCSTPRGLSPEALWTNPVLTLSSALTNPELYLIPYRVLDDLESTDRSWKHIADRVIETVLPTPALRRIAAGHTNRISFIISAAFLLVALGVFLVLMHLHNAPPQSPDQYSASSNADLRMRVEPQDDGVLVGWNGAIPAVRSARRGILQIDDGSQSRTAELGSRELSNGSFLCKPSTADMKFRLTIYGPDGSTLTEGIRLLDRSKELSIAEVPVRPYVKPPAASFTDRRNFQPSASKEPAFPKVATPDVRQKPRDVPVSAQVVNRDLLQPVPKPTPPEVAPVAAKTPPAESVAPPLVGPANQPVDSKVGEREQSPSNVAKPDVPPASVETQTQAHAAPASSTGAAAVLHQTPPNYVFPRPVKTVAPSLGYLNMRRARGTKDIQIEVDIDASGRVTAARPLETNESVRWLVPALIGAAKKWTFQPAQMDGRSVPAKHTIVFHFPKS